MRSSVVLLGFIAVAVAACIIACENFNPSSQSKRLILVHPESGIRTVAILDGPTRCLKVLPRRVPVGASWIEVEAPEHVWGRRKDDGQLVELLPLAPGQKNTSGDRVPAPSWRLEEESLFSETALRRGIQMTVRAQAESDGLRFFYQFSNDSDVAYEFLQPVTGVRLYSMLSDVYLERTFVHHEDGFELIASETDKRLEMTPEQWLPRRYLAPYTSEVTAAGSPPGVENDSLVWHIFSRKIDQPLLATMSLTKRNIVATYAPRAEYVWIDPEQTNHFCDPIVSLGPRATVTVALKIFIFEGTLDQLWDKISTERRGVIDNENKREER